MQSFCKKNAGISKTKDVSVLNGIFSESTHVFELSYLISSFRQALILTPTPKQTPKNPALIRVKYIDFRADLLFRL